MKKTVTLPDGTVEVLEGTPEEIASHEKLIREGRPVPKKSKPDVLKGAPMEPDDLEKLIELIKGLPKVEPVVSPPIHPWWPNDYWLGKPIWIVSCSMCQSYPCVCRYHEMYRITCGTYTSDGMGLKLLPETNWSSDKIESPTS